MAFRFQKFAVYIDTRRLTNEIFILTKSFPGDEKYGLVSQLRRAAVSIALNLAEGSDRGSDKEFNRFIRMAIGSVNEVVAGLDISLDNAYLGQQEYDQLILKLESIVKQLSCFCNKLPLAVNSLVVSC